MAGAVVGLFTGLASLWLVPLLFGAQYASAVVPGLLLVAAGVFRLCTGVASLSLRAELQYRSVVVWAYVPMLLTVSVGLVALVVSGVTAFAGVIAAAALIEFLVLSRRAQVVLRAHDNAS